MSNETPIIDIFKDYFRSLHNADLSRLSTIYADDIVFKDPLMVGAVTSTYGPPDPSILALGNPRPSGDGLRFDDPQLTGDPDLDPVLPVPEPATGLFVTLGLVALAARRRTRSTR